MVSALFLCFVENVNIKGFMKSETEFSRRRKKYADVYNLDSNEMKQFSKSAKKSLHVKNP